MQQPDIERVRRILFGYDEQTQMKGRVKQPDRRDWPMYTIPEVAMYIGASPSTLRTWFKPGFSAKLNSALPPLIEPADAEHTRLSFFNMIEAHILLSTRKNRKITMPRIRKALAYVRKQFPSRHPLIDQKFRTEGKYLFISRIEGDPINASKSGQAAFGAVLENYLERIEFDETANGLPTKLYPIGTTIIEINPLVASGRPTVKDTGILAAILWDRNVSGESLDSLATDFDLPGDQVREAIEYITKYAKAA